MKLSTTSIVGFLFLCFHFSDGNTIPRQFRRGDVPICCRCISVDAACNNNLHEDIDPNPGLTCKNEIEEDVFGCDVGDFNVSDIDNLVDLRSNADRCLLSNGQKTCCDPVSSTFTNHIDVSSTFTNHIGGDLVDLRQDDGDIIYTDTRVICQSDDVGATTYFEFGVACGKRDSRAYFDAGLDQGFTNPGEWPWAVLIYEGPDLQYVGSGALVDTDVVLTVAHKVRNKKADSLVVHLGDWDPNTNGGPFGGVPEKHPHIEMEVDCVRIHEGADLDKTLENNIAVLKLKRSPKTAQSTSKSVLSVVKLRRGDDPDGPPRTNLSLSDREGLLTDNQELDPLGSPRLPRVEPSYINTVCLPGREDQFTTETCWVAAWGRHLQRQREVDIPLLSRADCQRILEPEFTKRGVLNWKLKPSEICAGGIPGKDTCEGEGGAPLVCYSRARDQYFAVGLVNYGFGCNGTLPGVYTNLQDNGVRRWIKKAFDNQDFCSASPLITG